MSEQVLGIDLGTTFSASAYVDDDGVPHVVPNANGQEVPTPSVVRIHERKVEVGDVAMNQWVTDHEHVVRWIKRSMGAPQYRFQGMSAIEISAEILKQLKSDAEGHLGQAVNEAVITCPAYFASLEIESTKAAGELAGFRVREIVKEPTAAAVYYGIENMRDRETILVCDLGGGTYDATVMAFSEGVFAPLATRGDVQLGGHDWTLALETLVVERVQSQFGIDPRDDLVAGQMLYEACEQAKRDLAQRTEVSIACQHDGKVVNVKVAREDFELATAWLMDRVVNRSEEAVSKARLDWSKIDKILLVGGSSRLSRLGPALEQSSGKTPIRAARPDLMVALGAAVLAKGKVRPRKVGGLREIPRGGLVEAVYKRTIARSLGTRTVVFDGGTPRITNALVIPQGAETPVSQVRSDFSIASNGQVFFDAPVVEFENDDDFVVVANFRFRCPPNARKGDTISLSFNYDVSGISTVEARLSTSGAALACERLDYVEPDLDELSRAQVRVQPLWVVFALDASYSMDENRKLETAKRSVIESAQMLLNAGIGACKVGVVTFADRAYVCCRPTDAMNEFSEAVEAIQTCGMTAMDEGIEEAARLLGKAPEGAIRQLVMVTDGMPDGNRRDNTVAAAARALTAGIDLVSIALGADGVDVDYLGRLTTKIFTVTAIETLGDTLFTLLAVNQGQRSGGLQEVT
jgi:molecular chaperone DnaK